MARYHAGGNERTQVAPMLTGHAGVGVLSGFLYAVRGESPVLVSTSSIERYDPVTNTWEPVSAMSTLRIYGGLSVLGGFFVLDRRYQSSLKRYDQLGALKKQWHHMSTVRMASDGLGTLVLGSYLYADGGRNAAAADLVLVGRYSPAQNKWEMVKPMVLGLVSVAWVDWRTLRVGKVGHWLR